MNGFSPVSAKIPYKLIIRHFFELIIRSSLKAKESNPNFNRQIGFVSHLETGEVCDSQNRIQESPAGQKKVFWVGIQKVKMRNSECQHLFGVGSWGSKEVTKLQTQPKQVCFHLSSDTWVESS